MKSRVVNQCAHNIFTDEEWNREKHEQDERQNAGYHNGIYLVFCISSDSSAVIAFGGNVEDCSVKRITYPCRHAVVLVRLAPTDITTTYAIQKKKKYMPSYSGFAALWVCWAIDCKRLSHSSGEICIEYD